MHLKLIFQFNFNLSQFPTYLHFLQFDDIEDDAHFLPLLLLLPNFIMDCILLP